VGRNGGKNNLWRDGRLRWIFHSDDDEDDDRDDDSALHHRIDCGSALRLVDGKLRGS